MAIDRDLLASALYEGLQDGDVELIDQEDDGPERIANRIGAIYDRLAAEMGYATYRVVERLDHPGNRANLDDRPHAFQSADLGNPTYAYCVCGRQRGALTHFPLAAQ